MFLKRVEIQGFKSFADKVVISFDHPVTGVVGPNGCGKSNITDAIRWVLGEQSVKSLRGNTMTDVIFAGSADRKMVNLAEVTLVFDNTKKQLHNEKEEIEITRRIYRNNAEAEYLINRVPCRLKDIVELIMDTGLGKDSLSMISQGNISSFAEAKPVERRAIFEEAAGVSKYKKRKIESLSKLERTTNNLERVQDIVSELERQVSPLKRQAKKAELYREKKERLKEIEIAVLVSDINQLNHDIEDAKKTLFDIESQSVIHTTSINMHETAVVEARKQGTAFDHEINGLQEELMRTINEIQTLENRKTELDEKRKYAIEVGNIEEKTKELSSLVEEAKIEYEDRKSRHEQFNVDIKLLSSELNTIAMQLAEASQKKEESAHKLRRSQNRQEVLENLIKEPFNSQAGVKSIMDNQNYFKGVWGVIGKSLIPEDGYEEAITVALGGAIFNIVTVDEKAARECIDFLKRNRSGRATFLPARVCKSRHIKQDHQIICNNTKGYLGNAASFVNCEERFNIINESLLQNVIVCDTLENGNILADLLEFNYKIVTLDGDVIHRGGSMSGGNIKNSTSIISAEKELKDIKEQIIALVATNELKEKDYITVVQKKESVENLLLEKRIGIANIEPVLEAKRAKFERLKSEYEELKPMGEETLTESFSDSLIAQLNNAYHKRDEVTTSIKVKRDGRMKISADAERKEQQIRQIRKELQEINQRERDIQIDSTRLNTKLENALLRLTTEYQLTYEFAKTKVLENDYADARNEVLQLRQEIEALGNVNMNAPEEYAEVNERYEFITKQMSDLIESRDKILNAIDDMDEIMVKMFSEMFNKINEELNDTFRILFGGGKAKLILEDPDDLLNTGIDIDVQPPGKHVQNIRLFSGGEKSLIAISVLFSILKVKPVPLCIFDEVEAALDQGNVERVAKYLKNFKSDSQFIIVTHRPGTMEQCDMLYGVTMQKQGVSQMLKVELKEAVTLAEEGGVN